MDGNRVRIGGQSEAELHDGISGWILAFAGFQPQDVGLVQAAVLGQLIPGFSRLGPESLESPGKLRGSVGCHICSLDSESVVARPNE